MADMNLSDTILSNSVHKPIVDHIFNDKMVLGRCKIYEDWQEAIEEIPSHNGMF